MLALVCGVLVVLQSFANCNTFSQNEHTVDTATYNYTYQHLLKSQKNIWFNISQVSKTEVPLNFMSPQNSCVWNGSYPCPLWTYCDDKDGLCKCPHITTGALSCNGLDNINVHVLDCNCVTYDEELSKTEVGFCYYNCIQIERNSSTQYLDLPSNTSN